MKRVFIIITQLLCAISVAQTLPQIAVEGHSGLNHLVTSEYDGPCSQVVPSDDEALGFGTNFMGFVMGDNYEVAANDVVSLNTLIINVITADNVDVATSDIKIHIDVNGFPGAVLEFFDDLAPVDQVLLEDFPNENSLHQVTFDLSASSLELTGGAGGTRYWIAITTTAAAGVDNQFWEVRSDIINGQGVFSANGGATWQPLVSSGIDYEFIMTVEAECLLSNSDVTARQIAVYPNPTSGDLYVQGVEGEQVTVEIYNVLGSLLTRQTTNTNAIDVANLPSGIYLLRMEVDNSIVTKKIVKE
ncbi:MAG: T9SS type A sorting domain-containing protein [Bacteroidota bacterium]